MSQYLRNLIARHRPGAVRPGASGFVHPRLASRFEEHPMITPVPGPDITGPVSADVAGQMAPARDEPARSDRPAGTESIGDPEAHRPPRPSSTRRASRAEPPEPNHAAIEQAGAILRGPRNRPRGAGTTAKPARKRLRSSDRQPGRMQHDLQGRTDPPEAAAHAAGRQPRGAARGKRPGRQVPPAAEDAFDTVSTAAPVPPRTEPSAPESRQRPSVTMQDLESGQRFGESEPPGVLRTPDWTAKIQAMLSERSGEPHPPAESEPTVNVTIGRIDIRAVRQEHRERSSRATAPSRIMSLGDYLKKRDGRQR